MAKNTTSIKIDDTIITFHDYLALGCFNDNCKLINMLSNMFNISYYRNMFKREMALEKNKIDLMKSIFLVYFNHT